jgi:hypothetical protein
MYHKEHVITPTQQATNGALDIFVEGCRKNDMRQQLFGLSVLRSATEAQVQAAMAVIQESRQIPVASIEALFAR